MAVRQAVSSRAQNTGHTSVRWWTRRTTQAAAMGALMIVALAVGPSLGILPSVSERVDGVERITTVIHDSDTPVHTR
ncbi:hypothetical protein [Embleya sp. NBC_00896]|uniref:hypothetical protein n=1 Tax=Embleya sp. NBC_00896 TaxID=2975961 RepID=UPI00386D5D8C|nr:hypothetical protein OG928_06740 [Embleya sp. NBC_00896]